MGSPCEVQVYAASDGAAKRAAQGAVEEVERLEARYSRYRPDSLLSSINAAAERGEAVTVDE